MPEATKKIPVKYSAKSRKCIKQLFMVDALSWESSNKKWSIDDKKINSSSFFNLNQNWLRLRPFSLQLTSMKKYSICFENSQFKNKQSPIYEKYIWNKTNLVTLFQIQKSRKIREITTGI